MGTRRKLGSGYVLGVSVVFLVKKLAVVNLSCNVVNRWARKDCSKLIFVQNMNCFLIKASTHSLKPFTLLNAFIPRTTILLK